jgi:hypothetical protein
MAKVETAFRMDTTDLKASFRHALSFSIPPPALYCNHHPGASSESIFGVPLAYIETNQGTISKVMKMCIDEVEKRGLDIKKIYEVT